MRDGHGQPRRRTLRRFAKGKQLTTTAAAATAGAVLAILPLHPPSAGTARSIGTPTAPPRGPRPDTTPSGTWGAVDTFSKRSSAGTNATTSNWTSGSIAVFSAGTDATGNFTITISGTQTASGITYEEGTVTLNGGGLTLDGQGPSMSAPASRPSYPMGGTVGLTKNGTGQLNLTAINTFTGTVVVNDGNLRLTSDNELGATGNDVTLNGGILSVNSLVTLDANRTINIGSNGGTFSTGSSGTLIISGVVSGGTAELVKSGVGTLILSGTSGTFSGTTTLSAGTLQLGNALSPCKRVR